MNLLYDERFSPAEIAHRVQSIGQRISSDFPETPIVLIAILKGAALFASDLARTLPRSVRLEYIDVIRGGEEEIVDFHFVTPFNVRGADIIILKDVIRSGIIESYLADQLREEGPTSIRFAAIVDRPQERKSSLLVDYVLFPSEDGVLVGYGMEFGGEGGNFPFIAKVRTLGDPPFAQATGPINIVRGDPRPSRRRRLPGRVTF